MPGISMAREFLEVISWGEDQLLNTRRALPRELEGL